MMRFTLIVPVAPERDAPIIESIRNLDYDKREFHVVVIKGRNTSLNRNKGIDRSEGEYVVFLDDDAVIQRDYLKKIDEFIYANPNIDMVGGPQLTPVDDSFFGKVSGYALSSKFGAWKLSNRYSKNKINFDVDETALTSANLICRKEVVENVRFDENLFPGEDPKFVSDVKKKGYRVAYTPEIIVYHKRRAEFGSLVKQMFNYGRVRPEKESFFETMKMPFFFIPSLFFIYLVFLIGSVIVDPSITGNVIGNVSLNNSDFLWFVPLFAYLLLMLAFGFHDSTENNDLGSFPFLIFIYPSIHLSYGAGMIWGYLRKLIN